MSFTQTLKTTALLLSLSAGVAFAAELPANVKNIQATSSQGQISVLWAPVSGAASYRVYYSHESILGNGGNYDDFEQTAGSQTIFNFKSMPLQSEKIYIGILAVDKEGNESEGFETEAMVEASTSMISSSASSEASSVASSESSDSSESSSESMPSGENPTSTAVPMGIESVQAVTETGVLVTFTKDVSADAIVNAGYFLITTVSGTVLPASNTAISGKTVLITTAPQSADTEYVLGLLSPIPAADGTNATPSEPQVRFKTAPKAEPNQPAQPGQSYGKNPSLPGASPPTSYGQRPPQAPLDPSNLGLSAVLRKDGTYNVVARWTASPNAAMYSLYASKNGSPYSWNSAVDNSETSVQYSGITPGKFGIKVASRTNNVESSGIDKVIDLPTSGIGLLGIAAVAGAGAVGRRKKKVV